MKLLDMVKKGDLNSAKYKALIKKGLSSVEKESLKVSY